MSVTYATADGTATAGSDYTRASGKLRFAPGETEKTVSVPILDDAHDEGAETMRLRLSAASGAVIADGVATGTIENTDHIPTAWLARFGRTVTDQVLDAVEARLAASRAAGTRVRLAGQALPFWDADGHAKTAANDDADASGRVHRADARDREAVTAIRDWMAHAGANDDRRAWDGSPAGGMDALLGRRTLAGLADDDNGGDTASAGRLEAELGYGIALFGGGFTGTPNLGIGLSDTGRDYRLGWRLTSARRGGPGFEIGLEATRREAANADAEHGVMLRGTIRW